MTGNELRDTPGRIMLLWAVLLVPVLMFAWRVHLDRGQYDWVEYPTALGDQRLYTAMLGENDFFAPNLKFEGFEKGLYRRTFKPRTRADERMRKVALESGGRHFVYVDAPRPSVPEKGAKEAVRHYLKSGENAYIEFGERKYYPPNPDEPGAAR